MKRVYCLYRVSTKGQVERDDIPMQRQVCHEYAQQQGWDITKEFYEKGVSGFKVSAKDRDAVQEIQRDAAQGHFDILLVRRTKRPLSSNGLYATASKYGQRWRGSSVLTVM